MAPATRISACGRIAYSGIGATLSAVALLSAQPADAQNKDEAELLPFVVELTTAELQFDGAKSARVQGRLVGPATHEYTFSARKGQKVALALSSELSPWIAINLLPPTFEAKSKAAPVYTNFIDGTTRWEGIAPGNGTYTVRLGLLSSQARRVGRVDYELDVNLK